MTCTSSYPSSGSTSRLCFAMALEITAGVLSWLVNCLRGRQKKKDYSHRFWKIFSQNVTMELHTGTQTHMLIYQNALIEVPVAVLQTDSYDARVLRLCVIKRGLTWRAGAQGREGDGASVGAEGPGERGRRRSHGDTGRRWAGVHGVKWSTRGGFW